MKWSRHQQAAYELDIHDVPTDPSMPAIILPPSSPPLGWNAPPTNGATTPISSRNIQRKHSILPDFVGMFFVAVQILLLVRFALRLITPTTTGGTAWIGIIYTASGLFVLPFRLLFQHIVFPVPGSLEIYTLVAILCYGLLSRVLERFTKALLRSL
jgi:hypothetical protein